jgi:hypothetical protein
MLLVRDDDTNDKDDGKILDFRDSEVELWNQMAAGRSSENERSTNMYPFATQIFQLEAAFIVLPHTLKQLSEALYSTIVLKGM